jgi:hypothetical protein
MPTIGQIKEVVAGYLHKPVTEFVKGSGATEIDLLSLALNNARKTAERFHDFSICRKRGYFSIADGTADWRSPTWFSGTGTARKIKTWYERVSGGSAAGAYGGVDRVMRQLTQEQVAKLFAREDYLSAPFWTTDRYLSDAESPLARDPLLAQNYIITEGNNFYYYPQSTTTKVIVVDAFYWWPAWSLNATTDWWTENAEEFLIWQTMVEVNRLPLVFVSSEGNLPPPVKEASEALTKIVEADKDSTEGSIFIEDL